MTSVRDDGGALHRPADMDRGGRRRNLDSRRVLHLGDHPGAANVDLAADERALVRLADEGTGEDVLFAGGDAVPQPNILRPDHEMNALPDLDVARTGRMQPLALKKELDAALADFRHLPLKDVRLPDEIGDEAGDRQLVDLLGRPDLLDKAP